MALHYLALANLSKHNNSSFLGTFNLDKSIYPFSASTLKTLTTSCLPNLKALWMDYFIYLVYSLGVIIPSILLYSNKLT